MQGRLKRLFSKSTDLLQHDVINFKIVRNTNTKEIFILEIVNKLNTELMSPEEIVIHQGKVGNRFYFISKGDCSVNIIDNQGIEHIAYKLVVEGDHFGEVSLLYKCASTASVISRNYNTLSFLDQ